MRFPQAEMLRRWCAYLAPLFAGDSPLVSLELSALMLSLKGGRQGGGVE